MPVTLTLPDDMALHLSALLSNGVIQKSINSTATPAGEFQDKRPAIRVRAAVMKTTRGNSFSCAGLAMELGVQVSNASQALQAMQKEGVVRMIRRGTWQKAK